MDTIHFLWMIEIGLLSRLLQSGRIPKTGLDPSLGPGKIRQVGSDLGMTLKPDPNRQLVRRQLFEIFLLFDNAIYIET